MNDETFERYSAMLIWLDGWGEGLEFISLSVSPRLWYQPSFTPFTFRASYVQVIGPSKSGAGHVHAIAPAGTWQAHSDADVDARPVMNTPPDKERLARYMARHLDMPMTYAGRRYRASRHIPTVPRIRPKFGPLTYHVKLHGYRIARVFLPMLERHPALSVSVYLDGQHIADAVKACKRTRVYWPDTPAWLLDSPDTWGGVSRLRRQVQDAARRTCGGAVNAKDVLGLLESQHYRCATCGAPLMTPYGPLWHLDHIIPKSKGGSSGLDNLRVLCPTCNAMKHDDTDKDLARRLGMAGIETPFVLRHNVPIRKQLKLWQD